jgi:hypothetical protein
MSYLIDFLCLWVIIGTTSYASKFLYGKFDAEQDVSFREILYHGPIRVLKFIFTGEKDKGEKKK